MIFFYNIWFIYNGYDGNGRKTPKYIYTKNKEKFLVWLPSHPLVYKIGGRLLSGAKEPETLTCVHPTLSIPLTGCDRRTIFLAEWSWFEFKDFLFQDVWLYQRKITQSTRRLTNNEGDEWVHAVPKSISTKKNANSLVQGLNSSHWFHFLCR